MFSGGGRSISTESFYFNASIFSSNSKGKTITMKENIKEDLAHQNIQHATIEFGTKADDNQKSRALNESIN